MSPTKNNITQNILIKGIIVLLGDIFMFITNDFNTINYGYTRDEYRECEIYWDGSTKTSKKIQDKYREACKKPITFSYLHSADFDGYGNQIKNAHAKENRERVNIEIEKILNDNPFLKSLTQQEIDLMQYRPISSYEAHFQRKMFDGLL